MGQPVTTGRTIHATTVAIDGRGVLLRGASGSGKSDLALRLMENGAELVSDDRTVVSNRDGILIASAPPELAGLLEVRGVGILRVDHRIEAAVAMAADLVSDADVQRLPDPESETIEGVSLPRCRIAPFEASAPAKLRLALRHGVGSAL